jgi:hypothetical protein
MIVGITHTDCPNARSVAEIIDALDYLDKKKSPIVMTVNPMNKTSVLKVIIKLKSLILGEIDGK